METCNKVRVGVTVVPASLLHLHMIKVLLKVNTIRIAQMIEDPELCMNVSCVRAYMRASACI